MSDVSEEFGGEAPRPITRRTVTKAMAWAVPVVAVAASVPAYAASSQILVASGAACKLPGSSAGLFKGYALGFAALNPYNEPIRVTIESLVLNGVNLGGLQVINLNGCQKLGNDSFIIGGFSAYDSLVLLTKDNVNSQAGTLTVIYKVTGAPVGTVTVTKSVGTVPPIQSGSCNTFTDLEKACIIGQSLV